MTFTKSDNTTVDDLATAIEALMAAINPPATT